MNSEDKPIVSQEANDVENLDQTGEVTQNSATGEIIRFTHEEIIEAAKIVIDDPEKFKLFVEQIAGIMQIDPAVIQSTIETNGGDKSKKKSREMLIAIIGIWFIMAFLNGGIIVASMFFGQYVAEAVNCAQEDVYKYILTFAASGFLLTIFGAYKTYLLSKKWEESDTPPRN